MRAAAAGWPTNLEELSRPAGGVAERRFGGHAPTASGRTVAGLILAGLLALPACDPSGPDFDDGTLQSLPDLADLSFAHVQPAASWDYWELRHVFPGGSESYEIIGSGGELTRAELTPETRAALDATEPLHGFAPACLPALCFDFIIGVEGTSITTFTTAEQLRGFLGEIDNVTEATLMVHGLGFYWLPSEPRTGYREVGGSAWDFAVLELVRACAPVQTDRVLLRVRALQPVTELARDVWQREEGVCI